MQIEIIFRLNDVRRALRHSNQEISDYKMSGCRRRCVAVSIFILERGIITSTIAKGTPRLVSGTEKEKISFYYRSVVSDCYQLRYL